MADLTKKFYGRIRKRHTRRMSIISALRIIGLPPERFAAQDSDVWRNATRRKCQQHYGKTTFWVRNADCLDEIARDMKRVFHERLKQVGHDFTENHDAAAELIHAYTKAKYMFALHGVEV